ncbi:MAG: hypothetical protein R6W69_16070, partial [Anaerolineales bacterium]
MTHISDKNPRKWLLGRLYAAPIAIFADFYLICVSSEFQSGQGERGCSGGGQQDLDGGAFAESF